MRWITIFLLVVLAIASICFGFMFLHQKPRYALNAPQNFTVETLSITNEDSASLFGSDYFLSPGLSYAGGVALSGPKDFFGGWSAMSISPDLNRLIAISDTGNSMEAGITWNFGKITGLVDSTIAPVLSANGLPVSRSGNGDLEALYVGDDRVYLGFESFRSGIWVADRKKYFSENRYSSAAVPNVIRNLPKGRGIEAIARIIPPGNRQPVILVIAERDPGADSSKTPAWILSDDTHFSVLQEFFIETPDGFDVSDLAYDAKCGLFALERKLSWLGRFSVRLLKLNLTGANGAMSYSQEIIFNGDSSGVAIDNMEGLSAVPVREDVCAIFMISDDNFLPFQKTVLLNFEYRL